MKKAIIVGGSNGIGLAITRKLINDGYYACIFDRYEPEMDEAIRDRYEYINCNLLDFSTEIFDSYAKDSSVELLMITAGFGRVCDFEYLHPAEIDNLFKVNSAAAIKVIRAFYDRIKANEPFYCGVMGSIAGLVSSPMFSVYAATKAAVCRFTESVNTELEAYGTPNRILNVSPGSIKGTRFNGGENDLSQTEALAGEIVQNLFNHSELFIPQFDETFKGVIERYNADPHAFGQSSYEYKKSSGRAANENKVVIGYLSGTFDLFHVGHLNLIRNAKQLCDYLIVGVHPDASHKGKETFIPFDERMAVVGAIQYVDKVVQSVPEDSEAWEKWHFNKLFVGSDYKGTERFLRYEKYFEDKGVEIVYFPYTKSTNSTQIRDLIVKKSK
ncbi:MAG: SDR family NAD(P)-dependent oxidoreductase [Clostridia bacterium]|nr:SDR family NAD(P)-dependent oxidoreductase [Clostridia bacterium]